MYIIDLIFLRNFYDKYLFNTTIIFRILFTCDDIIIAAERAKIDYVCNYYIEKYLLVVN